MDLEIISICIKTRLKNWVSFCYSCIIDHEYITFLRFFSLFSEKFCVQDVPVAGNTVMKMLSSFSHGS